MVVFNPQKLEELQMKNEITSYSHQPTPTNTVPNILDRFGNCCFIAVSGRKLRATHEEVVGEQ
jgi:hypothetical protein